MGLQPVIGDHVLSHQPIGLAIFLPFSRVSAAPSVVSLEKRDSTPSNIWGLTMRNVQSSYPIPPTQTGRSPCRCFVDVVDADPTRRIEDAYKPYNSRILWLVSRTNVAYHTTCKLSIPRTKYMGAEQLVNPPIPGRRDIGRRTSERANCAATRHSVCRIVYHHDVCGST